MKNVFAVLALPVLVSGCSSPLDCGGQDAEKLVASIAKEKNAMVDFIINDTGKINAIERKTCLAEESLSPDEKATLDEQFKNLPAERVTQMVKEQCKMLKAISVFRPDAASLLNKMESEKAALLAEATSNITYTLSEIILTETNKDTGAVSCKAKLKGDIRGMGAASQPISYKLEKTTKGELFATVTWAKR